MKITKLSAKFAMTKKKYYKRLHKSAKHEGTLRKQTCFLKHCKARNLNDYLVSFCPLVLRWQSGFQSGLKNLLTMHLMVHFISSFQATSSMHWLIQVCSSVSFTSFKFQNFVHNNFPEFLNFMKTKSRSSELLD